MEGWVKLHRKLLEWEWYDEPNTFKVFIHCLLRANHKDSSWRGQQINRGSFITSYSHLSKETGLSVKQVRTALKNLEKTGEVGKQTTSHNSIITVLSYDSYQEEGKPKGKQGASEGQARGKQGATDKNDKNDKNEKELKEGGSKPKAKRFQPPSLQELKSYISTREIQINPETFIDHYTSNGWMVGRNKMKDWKAAVRNWEKKEKSFAKKEKDNGITTTNEWAADRLAKLRAITGQE